MACFDRWLNRITSLSQLLLVVVAILTVKLTVIPLYQKELNSEELAKAQMKLNSVQAETDGLSGKISAKERELADAATRLQSLSEAERALVGKLATVNGELNAKSKDLELVKAQNIKIVAESHRLKEQLGFNYQLRFRQSLEWYALATSIGRDCYDPELSEMFENAEERKAETAKGCGPYAFLEQGLRTLRENRKDPSGDPLDIPPTMLEKWFFITESKIKQEKLNLDSAFDLSIYKSLDPKNLMQKLDESDVAFNVRLSAAETSRDSYQKRARDKDMDINTKFIRNLSLPSGAQR